MLLSFCALIECYLRVAARSWPLDSIHNRGLRDFGELTNLQLWKCFPLGGSWVVVSGVINRVTVSITLFRGLLIPFIATHEPPSNCKAEAFVKARFFC